MNRKNMILKLLAQKYPNPKPALIFNTPFQLLIATCLSAQSTDKQVNKITVPLFADYPDLPSFLTLSQKELENRIKSCGLYKNKSQNIVNMCKMLQENYQGQVPKTMKELTSLPGVGRKTANVVLSNAFHIPAIAVDTHVARVSNRMGLADSKNVNQIEQQLQQNIPQKDWSDAHHWLIFHGRETCKARKPLCDECLVKDYCPSYGKVS